MGWLHYCIRRGPLTLSPTILLSTEPSPDLVRERVGGMCEKLSHLFNTSTTHSMALVTAGDSDSGLDMMWEVITGATEAMCPVRMAGKWRYGSGRAVKRFPQLPPAYAALPDHHQPASGSWRLARQPGNHLLLRWWPPASVALPKKGQKYFWELPQKL